MNIVFETVSNLSKHHYRKFQRWNSNSSPSVSKPIFSLLYHLHACMLSRFSHVQLFATPWTVAHLASLSMRILQARIVKWVAMPSSRGSSQPRDWSQVSHIAIRYQLSHQGSPRILEWVAYPFSNRSSRPRNQTGVSRTVGGFFTNWVIRETQATKIIANSYRLLPTS